MHRRWFCAASVPAIFGSYLRAEEEPFPRRRVWAGSDTNLLGAPSPDGRYLSYVDGKSGDLAIRDLTAGSARRLTATASSGQFAYFSIPSPDSRLVAYAWFNDERFYELRLIGLDGSPPMTVFRNKEAGFVQPCAWTPDGKQILTLLFRRDNSSQIVLVPTDGAGTRVLKSLNWVYPRKMDFSPDGRWIVYDSSGSLDASLSNLYVLAADGSRETSLVHDDATNLFPVWIRDGTRILFASDRDGPMSLWSIATSGGKATGAPQRLRGGLGRFLPMGITVSGEFYYGVRVGESDVYLADLESGKPDAVPVLKASIAPEWSPDGKRLAALTRVGAENFGQESRVISILSVESGRSRIITSKLAYLDSVHWAPDGQELLVGGSDRSARRGLFRVNAATGETSPVVREGAATYRGLEGVWADGGRFVLYIQESAIHAKELSTGIDRPLYQGAGVRHLALSRDGRWLAFISTSADRDALLVCRIEQQAKLGDPRQLASVPKDGISGIEWSPDHFHLYVSTPTQPVAGLWRVSLEGGQPERLPVAIKRQGGIRLNPDGRRIAFAQGDAQSEVWKMDLTSPSPGRP